MAHNLLSITQASSSFKRLVHIRHTHLYNWSTPSCYASTAAFNDCYSELTPYTALANS